MRFFHHLFLPQESNNHRSKLLHNHVLLSFVIVLLFLNILITFGKNNFSNVLGISVNITTEELLALTNKERKEKGLNELKFNSELSKAAELKARDMFERNYWAHNSPVGDTPWVFFKRVGYDYVYAGENLARGFSESDEIVGAWMKSPSHRDNMLSSNYSEVGFAILKGTLLGEETALVVELFGNRENILVTNQEKESKVEVSAPSVASLQTSSLINIKSLSKNSSLLILALFIFVLTLDMLIIEKKKIIRLVGHNLDHIFFLGIVFVLVLLLSKGVVL